MSYPQSIKQFVTKIDKNASGWYVGPEYFNVPASTPFELYLDHVPRDSATTQISASGGAAWTEIFTGTPGGNQYLIDYNYGKVTFSTLNAAAAVQATYYNLGDDIMAEHVNLLQEEIVNVETAVGPGARGGYDTVEARLNAVDVTANTSAIDGARLINSTVTEAKLIDNGISATKLMADIKGLNWVASGSPNLTDIINHKLLNVGAHSATAITSYSPVTHLSDTVQGHINSTGSVPPTAKNPHGISLDDITGRLSVSDLDCSGVISGGFVTGNIVTCSGNYIAINTDGPDADQSLQFYNNSSPNQQRLKWNDTTGVFEFSTDLSVMGNISASGNISPIGNNGASASGVRDVGSARTPFASGNFDKIQATSYLTGGSTGATGQFTAGATVVKVRNGIIISIV